MKKQYGLLLLALSLSTSILMAQGPYAPAAGQPGSSAISAESAIFSHWATGVTIERGYRNIRQPISGLASIGDESSAIGKAGDNGVVSLGDGGSAIVTFRSPISDVPGYDFAIFENGFDHTFLELAYVEVSSDGINFIRFESVSLTDTAFQVDPFGSVDPTNLYNLAGKYKVGYGTPFDLSELKPTPLLDINHITHIKIIDVVGSIDPLYVTRDSRGNAVNDPWPTDFPSSGFDLDAIGVISPLTGIEERGKQDIQIYPNPASSYAIIETNELEQNTVTITDLYGSVLDKRTVSGQTTVDLTNYSSGTYIVLVESEGGTGVLSHLLYVAGN